MNNFNDLCIMVYYPCAAGGKFIVNSLGLSKHCVLHDHILSRWDISQTNYDSDYYQTKLNIILKTVPDYIDKTKWQAHELGVGTQWLGQGAVIQPAIVPIINVNKHFCLTIHTPEYLNLYLSNYSKNKKLIKLTNYAKWLYTSAFKIKEIQNDIDNKVAYWEFIDQQEIKNHNYNAWTIDIDNNIWDEKLMQIQIENLYTHLNFDDFQPELWSQYYRKYIKIHQ